MTLAQRMGLFVATWRSEWAGLSRAQLALAVSAHTPRRGAVGPNHVRAWEEGQPPKTLEELDALCVVMRRHGVTQPEVGQFRDAVAAACVDRHYPGLLPDGDFAARPDCDVLAYDALGTEWGVQMGGTNTVALIAWRHDLEAARQWRNGTEGRSGQAHRQDLALAYVLHALAKNHHAHGRPRAAHKDTRECLVLVEQRLEGRVEELCRPHLLRWHTAVALHGVGQDAQSLRCFMELAEERVNAGDRHWWQGNLLWAAIPAYRLRDARAVATLLEHEAGLTDYATRCGNSTLYGMTHRSLCLLEIAQGRYDDAERRLATEVIPYERSPFDQIGNYGTLAQLASARGNHAEAESYREKQRQVAEPLGW